VGGLQKQRAILKRKNRRQGRGVNRVPEFVTFQKANPKKASENLGDSKENGTIPAAGARRPVEHFREPQEKIAYGESVAIDGVERKGSSTAALSRQMISLRGVLYSKRDWRLGG